MTSPLLSREEYIEQAYFFRTFRERQEDNIPSQEILQSIAEEVLATTNLPKALDFLRLEILHKGRMSDGMALLPHYFSPFQTFVMKQSEQDRSRFDQKIALQILEREAEYLGNAPAPAGLFVYQFECIARNRLGYHDGLRAIADDPSFDGDWREWILKVRFQLGTNDIADMIYYRSEHFVQDRRQRSGNAAYQPAYPILFGPQEGRIAKANRGKEPLLMFGALQRQLGYPTVPRTVPRRQAPAIHPALEERLQKIEKRLQLLDAEVKDEFDLSQFYQQPDDNEGKAG